MTKKLAILVHRINNSVIYTSSKSDLAEILGVSLSTIIRNYSDVGKYESIDYTIYVGAEKYENSKEKKYKKEVSPPTVKLYSKSKRQTIANNIVKMTKNDQVFIHDELEEETLLSSEQKDYYTALFKDKDEAFAYKKYNEWKFIDRPRADIIFNVASKMFKND